MYGVFLIDRIVPERSPEIMDKQFEAFQRLYGGLGIIYYCLLSIH
jgi:hypothetical protein